MKIHERAHDSEFGTEYMHLTDGEPKILVYLIAIRLIHRCSVDLIHTKAAELHDPVLTKLLLGGVEGMLWIYCFSRVYNLSPEVVAEQYSSKRSDRLPRPLFARLLSDTV